MQKLFQNCLTFKGLRFLRGFRIQQRIYAIAAYGLSH